MIDSDAFLDKPIGDEIVALYFPLWGADHAAKGLRAAQNLLIGTGHADVGGPWIPIGVGLHTGVAFVGTVGVEGTDSYDVTASATRSMSPPGLRPWPGQVRFSSVTMST